MTPTERQVRLYLRRQLLERQLRGAFPNLPSALRAAYAWSAEHNDGQRIVVARVGKRYYIARNAYAFPRTAAPVGWVAAREKNV